MADTTTVCTLMEDYAAATGLSDASRKPVRYLWTDAFAVCNFLQLYRQTDQQRYLDTACELVDQVHFVLGRYSENDSRSGWISGLDTQTGYDHPTRGGLRIGKKLPERQAHDVFDDQLEWDRDGQYFHYLTKWMQALTRLAVVSREVRYHRWALELVRAAHAGFTYSTGTGITRRMYWKMSIDLTRPLVASMGHHDPLDGLVTSIELQNNSMRYFRSTGCIDLAAEISDYQAMCKGASWATDDPLGTGGLLTDTLRLAQVEASDAWPITLQWPSLLSDGTAGVHAFLNSGVLDYPATHRLAFRELGLAIGLHAADRLRQLAAQQPHPVLSSGEGRRRLEKLSEFTHLASHIESYWLHKEHQQSSTWRDHLDINRVMLATSLAPDGYLLMAEK